MKTEILKTKQREFEVKIPSYYRGLCHTYKIVSDGKCVAVCDLKGYEQISVQNSSIVFSIDKPVEILEIQYQNKFLSVSKILSDL